MNTYTATNPTIMEPHMGKVEIVNIYSTEILYLITIEFKFSL